MTDPYPSRPTGSDSSIGIRITDLRIRHPHKAHFAGKELQSGDKEEERVQPEIPLSDRCVSRTVGSTQVVAIELSQWLRGRYPLGNLKGWCLQPCERHAQNDSGFEIRRLVLRR